MKTRNGTDRNDRPHHGSGGHGIRPRTPLALLGVLLLAGLTSGAVGGAAPAQQAPDCNLTFEPSEVRAGEEETEIHWTASESIPEVTEAHAAEDSGLLLELIEDRPQNLRVDASDAVVGEWMVTLMAEEEPVCTGLLGVI